MRIELDDLRWPAVLALLREHLDHMHALSPPESVHALDVNRLRADDIRFWTAWHGDTLLGCAALKTHDATLGELKSMRTVAAQRGRGVARALLHQVIDAARSAGLVRLSLETGAEPAFEPARRLYLGHGFVPCPPFAGYRPDPNSIFMTLALAARPDGAAAP